MQNNTKTKPYKIRGIIEFLLLFSITLLFQVLLIEYVYSYFYIITYNSYIFYIIILYLIIFSIPKIRKEINNVINGELIIYISPIIFFIVLIYTAITVYIDDKKNDKIREKIRPK